MPDSKLHKKIDYVSNYKWNDEYNNWIRKTFAVDCVEEVQCLNESSKIDWCRATTIGYTQNIPFCINTNRQDLPWSYIKKYLKAVGYENIRYTTIRFDMLSKNINITPQIIQENRELPWDTIALLANPNITWSDICSRDKTELYGWNVKDMFHGMYMSMNPNITWDIIRANPDCAWFWNGISIHPNITWDIIKANPGYPWNMDYVVRNPNITLDIILQNGLATNIFVMKNPNLTFDQVNSFILKHNNDNFINIYNFYNKFTAQAQISIAKYQLKANKQTNYLARYTNLQIIYNILDYYPGL